MTNRELYEMLSTEFPEVVAGHWTGFPFTEYSNEQILRKLSPIVEELEDRRCSTEEQLPLSQRQSYLAFEVINLCSKTEDKLYGDAIHQFADCIDNFRERGRMITLNERLLYLSLINLIIKTVQNCAKYSKGVSDSE